MFNDLHAVCLTHTKGASTPRMSSTVSTTSGLSRLTLRRPTLPTSWSLDPGVHSLSGWSIDPVEGPLEAFGVGHSGGSATAATFREWLERAGPVTPLGAQQSQTL
jgi:hypothetical protein